MSISFDGSPWVRWQFVLTVNSRTYIYFHCDWICNPKPIYMLFLSSFFNVSFAFLAVILLETCFLFGKHLAFDTPHVGLSFAALISASFCMLDIHHVWHVPGSLSTNRWLWLWDPHFGWWLIPFFAVFTAVITAVIKFWTIHQFLSQV